MKWKLAVKIQRKSLVSSGLKTLFVPLVALVAICCLLTVLGSVESGHSEESQKRVEDTIKKAVVSCYAIEGMYPATLEYVEEYYGLQIDHERYDVFYEIFADNIMPEITVVPKNNYD